ncbi:MAG: DMT family transporter [Deltaproteobacteria bacterium]|jgi:drug/metabolite transporter (DMT)-like permease|nr:DMT family transporter [Deltaproteobacteria bacterium]
MSFNKGLIMAAASPLAFSAFNVCLRYISEHATVWGIMFVRGCIGALLAGLAGALLGRRLWGRRTGLLSLVGLTGCFSTALTITAITLVPLYQAIVVLYLYPAMALLFSALLNGDRVAVRDVGVVGLAFLGGALLLWPDRAAGLELKLGHLIGVAGAMCYSLGYVLTARLGRDNAGLEPIFFYSMCMALLALPLARLFGSGLAIDSVREAAVVAAAGVVGSLGQLLGYAALRWLPAFKVGVVGTLEVFFGTLSSWLLFNDPMTSRSLIGGSVVVLAAFLVQSRPAIADSPTPA